MCNRQRKTPLAKTRLRFLASISTRNSRKKGKKTLSMGKKSPISIAVERIGVSSLLVSWEHQTSSKKKAAKELKDESEVTEEEKGGYAISYWLQQQDGSNVERTVSVTREESNQCKKLITDLPPLSSGRIRVSLRFPFFWVLFSAGFASNEWNFQS